MKLTGSYFVCFPQGRFGAQRANNVRYKLRGGKMNSLKQQLLLLVIGPVLLLSIFLTVFIGMHMKDRALLATTTKAKSDLDTGEAIISLMYPGPWETREGILYKGGVKISNNLAPVDKVAGLTGDTVTIFLGDTRVTTTVRNKNGERAIGTRVSDVVAATVLKNGQEYLGEANVVGELYQTAYKPIHDRDGKIIGMFYVGISKKLSDRLIRDSLLTMVAISAGITLAVAAVGWLFTQRVIIGPLRQITLGTREVAFGSNFPNQVKVTGHNEIGELAAVINQVLEGMQKLSLQISQTTGNATNVVNESITIPEAPLVDDGLPKGLHETTFRQILAFLQSKPVPMSAEEVGEGVNLTRVTARRYLEYLEKSGRVAVELKYGMVGRPVKLYKTIK